MDVFWQKLEIQNGHQEGVFGSFFNVKMTRLPLDLQSDYRISHMVFILSEHVAMYDISTCHMVQFC
jgi:hypothetical protein